ncbi:spore coat protein U domain-containing protein [Phyllobacterium endophyticum]|uniref:Spore coat protein U/FanG domain-containing protein n=2 Tax=Phyllobacterium endophyticum TaxID=1149773 RepID=A0A2P7AUE6_9HYPH|nr:hypothetical protein CU100_09120 [Phyllobacterium endophyticum]TYR44056.1 spore coat protein U domain-containing protein [Phyllobacterium endophyticum]
MKRFLLPLICLFVWFLAPEPASADMTCSFTGSQPFSFGNVDFGLYSDSGQDGSMTVKCDDFVIFGFLNAFNSPNRICVSLNEGTGGGEAGWRYLTDTTNNNKVKFQLYTDKTRIESYKPDIAFGKDVAIDWGVLTVLSPVTGTANYPIYAWLPKQQNVPEGEYSTRITAHFKYMRKDGANPVGCNFGGKSSSATFNVRVKVASRCSLDVTQHIDFGSWQDLNEPRDQEGKVAVTCDKGTSYKLYLGWGAQGDAGTTRYMANGDEKISYNLFLDKQRSNLWDGVFGGEKPSGGGDGNKRTFPIYARVPKQKTPSPGTYTDNVIVTLDYD